MVKRYFFLSLLTLICLSSFGNHPKNSYKKSRSSYRPAALVEVVKTSGKSFVLRSTTASQKPISFVITDSRGIVVMFGDNYKNGSILNFSHFQTGSYTMYFDNDTNSAAAYFTVSK